jgi:general secretion pathway protein K
VSPLSLLTFFAAAKKVSAAPHRGNASEPEANRGCQPNNNPKTKSKNQNPKQKTAQKTARF